MKQTKSRLAAAYALDLVVHTRLPWLWLAQVAAEAVVTAMMVPVSIPDQPNHPLVKQIVVSVRDWRFWCVLCLQESESSGLLCSVLFAAAKRASDGWSSWACPPPRMHWGPTCGVPPGTCGEASLCGKATNR